jgi:3-methylcrotonyl-CoA carboxylase alpha subunit
LQAPMPGKVLALRVQVGDTVQAGDTLAILEAMKMEHNLTAPHDGVVTDVLAPQGSQIAQGQAVLKLQPLLQEPT